MPEPVKVLVVDDSALARNVLRTIIASDPGLVVVGEAENGRQAVQLVEELKPDVVTMDVEMPIMNGYEAVEAIMAYHPTPILVVSLLFDRNSNRMSMRMLNSGALDVVGKPDVHNPAEFEIARVQLISRLKMLARVPVVTHLRGRNQHRLPPPAAAGSVRPEIVALAASTGGPTALREILRALPRNFPMPILIVQHIAHGFTQTLIEWLGHRGAIPVTAATDRRRMNPGTAYVAPEESHLVVHDRRHLGLKAVSSQTELRPSADLLFESIAQKFGKNSIGIILTGMGDDGAKGLKVMRDAGAYTIGQDRTSSVIYGMPRVAAERGALSEVLPLEHIPTRLIGLVGLSAAGTHHVRRAAEAGEQDKTK